MNLTAADSEQMTQYVANVTTLLISELIPYTTYYLRVAAVTIATGPYSEIAYGSTPEAGKCSHISTFVFLAV